MYKAEKHIAKQYSKNGAKGDATAVTKAIWTRKCANMDLQYIDA